MSEEREDPVNKEMRLYAEKAKYAKQNAPILAAIQNIQTKVGKTQNVNVVGLDIPFWDLVWLTVYNGFAVLIGIILILSIVAVPILAIGMFLGPFAVTAFNIVILVIIILAIWFLHTLKRAWL